MHWIYSPRVCECWILLRPPDQRVKRQANYSFPTAGGAVSFSEDNYWIPQTNQVHHHCPDVWTKHSIITALRHQYARGNWSHWKGSILWHRFVILAFCLPHLFHGLRMNRKAPLDIDILNVGTQNNKTNKMFIARFPSAQAALWLNPFGKAWHQIMTWCAQGRHEWSTAKCCSISAHMN